MFKKYIENLAREYHENIIEKNPQAEAYAFDTTYMAGYAKCFKDLAPYLRIVYSVEEIDNILKTILSNGGEQED